MTFLLDVSVLIALIDRRHVQHDLAHSWFGVEGQESWATRDLADKVCPQYRLAGSAVLLASGRPLLPLAKVLASHSLIHAAEGEFYREVFSKA